ncbi:13810_t:CDS:2 [Entrophospora sp. SA101]|nr:13810_t:CDS:2 [Entrophospora sp. SA101]
MHGKLPPHQLQPFIQQVPIRERVNPKNSRHPYCLNGKAQHPYHILVIGTQEYYQHAEVATGFANLFGNKGGVGISLLFGDTSFCFINCHLAAHQNKVKQRNNDVRKISKEMRLKGFRPEYKVNINNVTDRFDHTFWFGDMNYRVDLSREKADELILRHELTKLLEHDQLSREMKSFSYFDGFHEDRISFNPTFKFNITHRISHNSHEQLPLKRHASAPSVITFDHTQYDTSPKKRVPSWTDRIIWKTMLDGKKVIPVKYTSHMNVIGFSDHRPVTGCYLVDFDWQQPFDDTSNQKKPKKRFYLR